ncbi:MAG: alpha/beta hydrolase [Proteobacteria bacterium]|nr:MAG: alpha/beta hydrolase [Pseudomonadota bacterium]
MAFLDLPGFRLHYEVLENALPGDVLFLHGNLAANLWWEPAKTEWASRRDPSWKGRMILAEWRGCGKSAEFEGSLSIDLLAADMQALAKHLKLDEAGLVGHSTGGIIALHAALSGTTIFDRLLLLDSVTAEGVAFGADALSAFDLMAKDRATCAAVILGTIHGGSLSEEFKDRIVEATFTVSPKIWRGVPAMLKSPAPWLDYKLIRQRILVLHGEEDNVLPIAEARAMAAALPNAEFRALPGRGHCTNVEDPALFVTIAHDFLFA